MATIGINIRTRVERGCDIVRLISTSDHRIHTRCKNLRLTQTPDHKILRSITTSGQGPVM